MIIVISIKLHRSNDNDRTAEISTVCRNLQYNEIVRLYHIDIYINIVALH